MLSLKTEGLYNAALLPIVTKNYDSSYHISPYIAKMWY